MSNITPKIKCQNLPWILYCVFYPFLQGIKVLVYTMVLFQVKLGDKLVIRGFTNAYQPPIVKELSIISKIKDNSKKKLWRYSWALG